MSDERALLEILGETAEPSTVQMIERLISYGSDRELNRINVLTLASETGLDEEDLIAAFLHAARLGLFDLSWNVLCPGCGGVLDTGASLKLVNCNRYSCTLCAAGYEPTLDEMVEVTFTVSPRVRKIAAHDPDSLPWWEYYRQILWGSGLVLPEDFKELLDQVVIDAVEIAPGERISLALQLPAEFIIIFEPVTHASQFIAVKGEPTRERQHLSLVLNEVHPQHQIRELRPGPLRLSIENRTDRRVRPAAWIANDTLHRMLAHRRPFLTAKRLLTNQTFRDIYQTGTLDIDQRLKVKSLTFLFTDLKDSTELYERVGDLVAYDLVQEHFITLTAIVSAESGAVVRTIGDAIMATFPTPDRAVAAALRMREAMTSLNQQRGHEDLLLKIGIHEGPCLAVMLNDRQDYFGQTVNIASRVQNFAGSRSIVATSAVIEDPTTARMLDALSLLPVPQQASLRGIPKQFTLYEIP